MKEIRCYHDLNQNEIDLINEVKALGSEIEKLHSKVQSYLDCQHLSALDGDDAETRRLGRADPSRFAALAKTDFQTALMYLTRAIAQPENF